MLKIDQNTRITAAQVLNHPWIKNRKKYEDSETQKKVKKQILKRMSENRSSCSKFKKICMNFLVRNLTDNEAKDLIKVFQFIDQDKDGYIT